MTRPITHERYLTILLLVLGCGAGSHGCAISHTKLANHFKDCEICPAMVEIPPGGFEIGSPEGEQYGLCTLMRASMNTCRERPQTEIRFEKGFAVGKYEVTKAEFLAYVRATKREKDHSPCESINWHRLRSGDGLIWTELGYPINWEYVMYSEFGYGNEHPVVCVSWWDAKRYLDWLSGKTGKRYRLLSEAEWEYVARAGSTGPAPWGVDYGKANIHSNVLDAAWMKEFPRTQSVRSQTYQFSPTFDGSDDQDVYSSPVGRFAPNKFGVHDMIGNVWEWVEDCWHESYLGIPTDGTAWKRDCIPTGSEQVVHRGGSFADDRSESRFAERASRPPNTAADHIGFRVARDL